ncbi:hypothetical protein [Streptomyces niveus]|uniref:hypothetical protein n=1 Tax=Streptomyces niveus TaxID=193462 RepID=UPI0035E1A956
MKNLDPAQTVRVLPRHLTGPGPADPRYWSRAEKPGKGTWTTGASRVADPGARHIVAQLNSTDLDLISRA